MGTDTPFDFRRRKGAFSLAREGSQAVFRIRIHMFLGHKDPDPLVRGMDPDPDPSIIKQK
jgi:hypothetical protein